MFNSHLPLSPQGASAPPSLEPPPAQYHYTSPRFQLVPLQENGQNTTFPFSGQSALSPTSPSGRVLGSPSYPMPLPIEGGPSGMNRHRASISSSSTADASSTKGSPASPLVNLPTASSSSNPASSTSKSTSKVPFVPPPPPPPLSNPLDLLMRSRIGLSQLIGHGNIDARPSRQGAGAAPQKSGACAACRAAKAKCSQDEPSCARCLNVKIECVYPVFAKRGRKRTMTPNQLMLENCHRDIEQALALLSSSSTPHSAPPPLPPISSHPSSLHNSATHTPSVVDGGNPSANHEEEDSGSTRELKDVLENPLALLAHISSLKVGGDSTTDEESGKHFLPQQTNREAEPTVEGYFATGLYQLRSDADPAYDPVSLGIITEDTLARFVDFYFTSLHPFVFHLTPSIHTPRFLRDTSPFLTTALACICSTFDPASQSTVPALFNHLQLINTRIWSEGLKSLEIIQAYMLLIHWTPIANNWGDDRRWGWLGTAIRMATEIKLHKTLNQVTYDFYRSVTPLSDDAFQRLSDDRIRSWRLISVAETALGVSTGRLGAISNLCSVWPGPPTPKNLSKDHPHYNIYAHLELTKIYANGICLSNNITDTEASTNFDIRASFKSKWTHDLQQWRQTWIHANHYVRMIYSHNLTILLSISLRFRGPVAPILEECRAQAFETATLAVQWPDDSYKWGSNLSVVVVAYAATLLLRIGATKPGPLSPIVARLCSSVADTLLETGATRPQTRTLATLHGTRIRTLLQASTAPTAPQPLPSSLLPSDLTAQPSLNHPQIHATFETFFSKEVQLYPPVFPGLEHPSSLSSYTNPNAADSQHRPSVSDQSISNLSQEVGLKPDSDHLWSLPSSESHMLWDLFHDHRPDQPVATNSQPPVIPPVNPPASDPTSLNPFSPSQLLVNSRPSTSGGISSGSGSGSGTSGSKRRRGRSEDGGGSAEGGEGVPMTGTDDSINGGEDWVHRNALETDWLNSEPGAWAW